VAVVPVVVAVLEVSCPVQVAAVVAAVLILNKHLQ
jgi:hypothetical protein